MIGHHVIHKETQVPINMVITVAGLVFFDGKYFISRAYLWSKMAFLMILKITVGKIWN